MQKTAIGKVKVNRLWANVSLVLNKDLNICLRPVLHIYLRVTPSGFKDYLLVRLCEALVSQRQETKSTFTCKEGFPCEHLCKDAASRPHVDGFGVVVRRQQQARRPVPLGDQTFREMAL